MRWPFLSSCAFVLSLGLTVPAHSETIRIEAETIFSYSELGGLGIVVRSCSAASGGLAVDGLDRVGEWIKLPLDLTTGACFLESVRSAGSTETVRTFAIHIESSSPGPLWAADTLVTPPGSGVT